MAVQRRVGPLCPARPAPYGRPVADGDVEALIAMTGLADELDAAVAEAVKGLRACGYS